MATQIIRQPNGLYCLFSSIVDNITHYDLSEEDIVDILTLEQRELIKQQVSFHIKSLEEGGQPKRQFTLTLDQALEQVKAVHGEEQFTELKNLFKLQQ